MQGTFFVCKYYGSVSADDMYIFPGYLCPLASPSARVVNELRRKKIKKKKPRKQRYTISL